MDTQTNGHARTKNAVRKGTRKASTAVKSAEQVVDSAGSSAEGLVQQGAAAIDEPAGGGWVARNPKKAVGLALGAGLLVGSLMDGKYLRAAAIGAIGLVGKRFF